MKGQPRVTRRQALQLSAALAGTAQVVLSGCTGQEAQSDGADSNTRHIRLLATSDLHGKSVPWNYATDSEDLSGSMAQLATAIKEHRDEDNILIDAGDSIQDNMAELFIHDEVHPMIACLNELGYDIGATGNHEYNYGMDVLRHTIEGFEGTVVAGNVWDENGDPIAQGHTIIEKNDVRLGFIGMVTPNIKRWDKKNLEGCKVSDPVEETRAIIDQIPCQAVRSLPSPRSRRFPPHCWKTLPSWTSCIRCISIMRRLTCRQHRSSRRAPTCNLGTSAAVMSRRCIPTTTRCTPLR